MACHLTEEALGEVVHEVNIGAVGADVDLLVLRVPLHVGMEHSHAPLFELEVVDAEVGAGGELVEQSTSLGLAGGLAAELYGVEVDEFEDIAHLYLVQVDGEEVVPLGRGNAVDDDVLFAPAHHEVVYQQAVFVVDDVGGLHVPRAFVEDDV